jgi:hypothetical protein
MMKRPSGVNVGQPLPTRFFSALRERPEKAAANTHLEAVEHQPVGVMLRRRVRYGISARVGVK